MDTAAIDSLPPGLTIWQGAALLRQPYARVRSWMRKKGYEPLDGRKLRWKLSEKKYRVDWTRVNWSRSNIAIANQYGVSREIVRRMRNRLKMPFVEARGAKPKQQRKDNHAPKKR